jgi:hypothetical protein
MNTIQPAQRLYPRAGDIQIVEQRPAEDAKPKGIKQGIFPAKEEEGVAIQTAPEFREITLTGIPAIVRITAGDWRLPVQPPSRLLIRGADRVRVISLVPARHVLYIGEATILFDEVIGANVEVFSSMVIGLYHAQILPGAAIEVPAPAPETTQVPTEQPGEVAGRFRTLRGLLRG